MLYLRALDGAGGIDIEHYVSGGEHGVLTVHDARALDREHDVGVLAHLIEAGSDMTLIPSRIEPSGVSAMYSLKYGALPIARAAGGIYEIIEDYDPVKNSGYGFLYYENSTEALWDSIKRAREIFRNPAVWNGLVERAMARDFSWKVAAGKYEELYASLLHEPLAKSA